MTCAWLLLTEIISGGDVRATSNKIAGAEDDANYYAYQGHQADTHDDGQDHFPGFGLRLRGF